MTKDEAIKKLEETVGAYLLSGRADDTTCGEWREILETLEQEPCKVTEFDKDHIWYKGQQYISLRRFIEVKKEQESKFIAHSDGTIEQILTREHGEWIEHHRTDLGEKLNDMCECSRCNTWFSISELLRRSFCPNCGADMRGEQKHG